MRGWFQGATAGQHAVPKMSEGLRWWQIQFASFSYSVNAANVDEPYVVPDTQIYTHIDPTICLSAHTFTKNYAYTFTHFMHFYTPMLHFVNLWTLKFALSGSRLKNSKGLHAPYLDSASHVRIYIHARNVGVRQFQIQIPLRSVEVLSLLCYPRLHDLSMTHSWILEYIWDHFRIVYDTIIVIRLCSATSPTRQTGSHGLH